MNADDPTFYPQLRSRLTNAALDAHNEGRKTIEVATTDLVALCALTAHCGAPEFEMTARHVKEMLDLYYDGKITL